MYTAAGLLVVAQIVGIYGLITRKADLVLSLVVIAMLVAAALLALYWTYHQLS
jgi:hypothetical protein